MEPAAFNRRVESVLQDICRDVFEHHRGTIKVKKDKTANKNLPRIFEAALRISNRRGFRAMTMRDLGRETGLSMGALYGYFSGKDELLEMLQETGRLVTARVLEERIEAERDVRAKLRTAVHTHLYLSEAMQPWFYFSYMEARHLTPSERDKAIASELYTEKLFADIIRSGQLAGVFKDLEPQLAASAVKALLQDWYVKRWKYAKRSVTVEQYAAFVVDLVQTYVMNPDRASGSPTGGHHESD